MILVSQMMKLLKMKEFFFEKFDIFFLMSNILFSLDNGVCLQMEVKSFYSVC